ncbi:shikimate dehydrogenase [Candidatus Bathyarchaeota archaeon]|nr:shikimate dehydrogenase [Candidatus Bathyarchaeota archaeon]
MSSLEITSRTRLCALIGDPVEHSLSPAMQNAAFREMGVDAVYLAMHVKSEMLAQAVRGFKALNILGFNVTIPHKTKVMKYLDGLDRTATTIGAVNTVVNRDGKLIGYNTDGIGALEALRESGVNPKGRRIILVGAGGAARAIAFTLAEIAQRMVIVNRTVSKARMLARDVQKTTQAQVTYKSLNSATLKNDLLSSDLLVNATSIGMNPRASEAPIDLSLLRTDLDVFDIVYDPVETSLLKGAKEVGAKSVNGLMMLVKQGAQAFELWTGLKGPIPIMTEALNNALKVSPR